MNRLSALPKYSLTRLDGEERFYETPDGRARSVTTILDITGDKRSLMLWRESIGEQEADRIRDLAAARGTATHERIEEYLGGSAAGAVGNDDSYDFLVEPYWSSIHPFLQTLDGPPLVMESTVYHPDGFAGTLDCIAYTPEDTDQPSLIDWKTADKPLNEQKLYEYSLQVAAYRKAANYVYKPHGLNISRAVIAVAIWNEKAQVEVFDEDALDQLYQHFLARLNRVTYAKALQSRRRTPSKTTKRKSK